MVELLVMVELVEHLVAVEVAEDQELLLEQEVQEVEVKL
jgi:hypothetical protein